MPIHTYIVKCQWDAEAGVWYVVDSDVPGLATEAETVEAMGRKLQGMIPELLALNRPTEPHERVPFELITHKQEVAHA